MQFDFKQFCIINCRGMDFAWTSLTELSCHDSNAYFQFQKVYLITLLILS